MIAKELQQPVTYIIPFLPEDYMELNRLLAAAAVSPPFCRLLLKDPESAIQRGYEDEVFHLRDIEYSLLLSIRADSLADLAQQLLQAFNERLPFQYSYPARLSDVTVT